MNMLADPNFFIVQVLNSLSLGMNLFISAYRFQRPVTEVIRASWPFFLLLWACALAITYIPWLSLVLIGRG